MLNIKKVRADPEYFRRGLTRRGLPPDLVDKILELDARKRSLLKDIQMLRHQRNLAAEQVAAAKKRGEKAEQLLQKMVEVGHELEKLEAELEAVDRQLNTLLRNTPNVPHESVPDGVVRKTTRLSVSGARQDVRIG
jgi:seryl-tRNA synthetase